jgi:hypothetical protein
VLQVREGIAQRTGGINDQPVAEGSAAGCCCCLFELAFWGSGSMRGCKSEIVAMQEQAQTNLVHPL